MCRSVDVSQFADEGAARCLHYSALASVSDRADGRAEPQKDIGGRAFDDQVREQDAETRLGLSRRDDPLEHGSAMRSCARVCAADLASEALLELFEYSSMRVGNSDLLGPFPIVGGPALPLSRGRSQTRDRAMTDLDVDRPFPIEETSGVAR